jgi:hypothetical protein
MSALSTGTMKVESIASVPLSSEVLRLHHLMAASYCVLKYVEHGNCFGVHAHSTWTKGLKLKFRGGRSGFWLLGWSSNLSH